MRSVDELLQITSKLDARYHLLRGEMERSKETTLLEVARIMKEAGTPYALIDGVAVQFHCKDPRTTIDIDLAILEDSAKSKRVQDLADAMRLVEDNPAIRGALTDVERARLEPL